jgi:hypothetical protein
VKKAGFRYLHTRNLNQVHIENTFHSHCCSNDNPTVGEFTGALKTSIISGLAFRGLHETNMRMMMLTFRISYNHCSEHLMLLYLMENCHGAPDSVAKQLQEKVNAAVCTGDIEMFSLAY